MSEETVQIPTSGGTTVTAIRATPDVSSAGWLFVYAPGAGSNVHDPFGTRACHRLTELGFHSVRFQFPYMEARKRRPDRTAVLEATWRAVVDSQRTAGLRLVVGGRSMGGRIASQVVAHGLEADALALFAYPLRPPYDPSKVRDAHLHQIEVPTLFCSGTRDTFATPDELRAVASKLARSNVRLLEGADHGFGVLKSSGRVPQDVWDEAIDRLVEWLP